MKTLYLFLMFSTSSLLGLYYGHMLQERKKTINELNNFFKYLIIRISTKSGTLLECVRCYKGGGSVERFLNVLTQKLECGCACPFESAATELYALKKEDLNYIKSISVGVLERDGQIKALENAVCYFENAIKEDRQSDKKRQIVSYSGVLAGLALVIVFI